MLSFRRINGVHVVIVAAERSRELGDGQFEGPSLLRVGLIYQTKCSKGVWPCSCSCSCRCCCRRRWSAVIE